MVVKEVEMGSTGFRRPRGEFIFKISIFLLAKREFNLLKRMVKPRRKRESDTFNQ